MLKHRKSVLFAGVLVALLLVCPVHAAGLFDAVYYAAAYPDVAAVVGTDSQALYNHYVNYGSKEGRIPFAGANPGEEVTGISDGTSNTADNSTAANTNAAVTAAGNQSTAAAAFQPVPINQLANLKSLKKKTTDAEFAQAYQAALEIDAPLVNMSREDQLYWITVAIRERFDNGMSYSMETSHYNDPYGYFVLGCASCAGCTRATGLCLNILGIPYEHVNENQYAHQWCRVNLNGTYWISDAFGLYCGPEPAPYTHPYM